MHTCCLYAPPVTDVTPELRPAPGLVCRTEGTSSWDPAAAAVEEEEGAKKKTTDLKMWGYFKCLLISSLSYKAREK